MKFKNSTKLFFSKIFVKLIKDRNSRADYLKIFLLTWPAFIELFTTSLFSVVDIVMIGRINASAIAGVGLTNQPFSILIAVFSAVNVGTTTLVSWAIGQGDRKKISVISINAIIFNIISGLVFGIIGVAFSKGIIEYISNDALATAYAIEYFVIICYGLVFQAVTMCISSIFRGSGETRLPMFYNIAANFVNIGLNYLLIYGNFGFPALGVSGAAIATTISRIAACAISVFLIFIWKKSPIKVRITKLFRPDLQIIRDILSIGLPAAGEQFVIQFGILLSVKIIFNSIGVAAYAAHQILLNVNGMAFSISQSFSIATTTLVGHAVGSNDYATAEKMTIKTRRLARYFTAFIGILLAILGRAITHLYTDDVDVIALAAPIFVFLGLVQFMQSTQMSTSGALRGAADTMYPLYASIIGIWIFRVPLTWLLVVFFKMGLVGTWLALLLDQTARLVLVNVRFKHGKWKTIKALKEKKKLMKL